MNNIKFSHTISVEDSMCFELLFEESLQMSLQEKKELLGNCNTTYLLVNGRLAGEIYSSSVQHVFPQNYEFSDFFDRHSVNHLLIFSKLKK